MQHFEAAKGRSQEGLLPYIYTTIYPKYIFDQISSSKPFKEGPKFSCNTIKAQASGDAMHLNMKMASHGASFRAQKLKEYGESTLCHLVVRGCIIIVIHRLRQ